MKVLLIPFAIALFLILFICDVFAVVLLRRSSVFED
jgi:uncharacterized membrane protein